MASPDLETLQKEIERQDRELAELFESLGAIDPRDIPPAFFDDLEEACEPRLAWSAPVDPPTTHPFGLRA
jgi:hypothetical protein